MYSVDGVQVATHAAAFSSAMRPLVSDLHPDANQISLDWLQMSPYVSTCSFTSRAIDGGTHQAWINLDPVVTTPAGTSVQFNTRTSNDAATWSAWSPVTGNQINSPTGRYLQYQAVLTTTNVAFTPIARRSCVLLPTARRPRRRVWLAYRGTGRRWCRGRRRRTTGRRSPAYVVTPYIGFIVQPARTFNSAATSQTITGLTNATTYTFKVAAKNANGTGPQSVAIGAGVGRGAGGADGCRWRAGERVGGGVVDGAGEQRVGDHRVCGDAVCRVGGADGEDVQLDGDVADGHGVDERDDVHVQGGGEERQRDGAAVGGIRRGDGGRAGGADGCVGGAGEWVGGGVVDGAGEQQRVSDHGLRGDAVCGHHGADGADVQLDSDVADGHGADQRNDVHVQGGGEERQRDGAAVGGIAAR